MITPTGTWMITPAVTLLDVSVSPKKENISF
jgi:hypothetical protein